MKHRAVLCLCFTLSFHSDTAEIEVGLALHPCKEKAVLNFHFRLFLSMPRDCFSQRNLSTDRSASTQCPVMGAKALIKMKGLVISGLSGKLKVDVV